MHVHPLAGVWLVRAAHALARETGSTERFFPDYQDRGFFLFEAMSHASLVGTGPCSTIASMSD
jgi:hypothetical protein